MTMAQYFKRQQKHKDLLKLTDVSLTEATLIWIAQKHFERVPFLKKAHKEWKKNCPPTATPTWNDCKRHFRQHNDEQIDEQATLRDASIANVAIPQKAQILLSQLLQPQNETLVALLAKNNQCVTAPTAPVWTINGFNSASDPSDKRFNQMDIAALS